MKVRFKGFSNRISENYFIVYLLPTISLFHTRIGKHKYNYYELTFKFVIWAFGFSFTTKNKNR